MKKRYIVMSMMAAATGLLLSACGAADKTESDELQVVTTFYPMYEFTQQVLGDEGQVELLIPAGTEAHDYEPSAKDLAKLTEADVFVYNSKEFETWIDGITDSLDSEKTTVIEAAAAIELMESDEEGHDHEAEGDDHAHEDSHEHELDPHVWLDPVLAIKEVETIRDGLSEKYPDKADAFKKNAAAYIEKLTALDEEFETTLKNATNRTFVTQHAAFGYLANRYDLVQESISGISPDQEPTASRLAELKHYVEDHQVSVIYFEENANSKVAETLSNETGVALSVLNPLEGLTTEQLENGENYISVMQDNLAALQQSIN